MLVGLFIKKMVGSWQRWNVFSITKFCNICFRFLMENSQFLQLFSTHKTVSEALFLDLMVV